MGQAAPSPLYLPFLGKFKGGGESTNRRAGCEIFQCIDGLRRERKKKKGKPLNLDTATTQLLNHSPRTQEGVKTSPSACSLAGLTRGALRSPRLRQSGSGQLRPTWVPSTPIGCLPPVFTVPRPSPTWRIHSITENILWSLLPRPQPPPLLKNMHCIFDIINNKNKKASSYNKE